MLRGIFNDIRFRQALSLSINRDELNETFFFGLATPRNYHVAPFSSLFEQWMADYFIDYDPRPRQRPARRDGPAVGR